ncbi:hypothetical protein EVG20_g2678 [Dentipellis fragilis]|uniref:Uncharacterized protein n=1 Tax=Dentipellis fragilis TaxID=205917 RepID=A0A4Y9Z8F6_9AGAM|nr:hypothetical protein EVG20_g2678 [Dentipellis fragilis]
MAFFDATPMTERPTLPPLHSLNLPVPGSSWVSGAHALPSIYDRHVPAHAAQQSWHRGRQVSVSSSISSRTASASPPPSEVPSLTDSISTTSTRQSTSPPPTAMPYGSVRIVLADSFEDADAALVFPPPGAPYIPTISDLNTNPGSTEALKQGKPLLLVGKAMEYLRHPQRRIAKGARIHPYRIVRSGGSRRSSMASTISPQ